MVLYNLSKTVISYPVRILRYPISLLLRTGRPSKPGTKGPKRITTGGVDMNEVAMLYGAEPRKILQTVIEKNVPAIMSYLSRDKWHVSKVQLTKLGACRLNIQIVPTKNPHPVNICVDQPVGISLKYGYGKFIFETKVVSLEPSPEANGGGTIVLRIPDRIEVVQRRSFFRVEVPQSLKVTTMLWHRGRQEGGSRDNNQPAQSNRRGSTCQYWQGRLIDISAGGAQVAVEAKDKENFRTGQFIGVRFTPMPYETPLMFNAQIRNILPTADSTMLCLGLQIVGLEASSEGRKVLSRLVGVVEQYYQLNQSSVRQQDLQGTPGAI